MEVSINQKNWPTKGRYIGYVNDKVSSDLKRNSSGFGEKTEDWEKMREVYYLQNTRVYGDEIPLYIAEINYI